MWIPEIKAAWKFWSMRAVAVATAVWSAWLAFPDMHADIVSMLGLDPGKVLPYIAFASFVFTRLKLQRELRDPPPGSSGG